MSLFFLTLFSFLAATSLAVTAVMWTTAAQTSPQARIAKRLIAIGDNPNASQAQIQSLLKGSSFSDISWINGLLSRLDFVRGIGILLERANMDMSASHFLLLSLFPGGIVLLVLTQFGQPFLLAFVAGVIASLGPYFYVKHLARKRLRRFLEQMPDGLDAVGQGLQAGMGLTQALTMVAKDMPDPFGTEFSIFMEELNLGLPLTDALKNLQERIPLPEVRLFNNAIVVQREAGGSLAELLNKLGDVIRDRFRIERQVKTLTAQNRLSAWVVSSMPVFLALFMYFMDPEMMGTAFGNPVGRLMLIAAVVFEVLGIFTFMKLLKIHI